MIRTKELQIISDRPINASIDGEAMQSDHFDLKLIPKRIALEFNSEFICPEETCNVSRILPLL